MAAPSSTQLGRARMERCDRGEGFYVLDGAALVMGAAIGSVHGLRMMRGELSGAGWCMMAVLFVGASITAAGPFVFLERRMARRGERGAGLGDQLWALLGMPWVVSALIWSIVGEDGPAPGPWFSTTLAAGLVLACSVALGVLWGRWVSVPPERAERVAGPPWTNRLGLALAVAWPVQCGLGLLVLG